MNFDGRKTCVACAGTGHQSIADWRVCVPCDGTGRTWDVGGPLFGCSMTLADRAPGEIVILGTGARVRVQWQSPRDDPEVTFVTTFDDFGDLEDHTPKSVHSAIGVSIVELAKPHGNKHEGDKEKNADLDDPLAKRVTKGNRLA